MATAASPPGSGPVKEEAVEEPEDRPHVNGEAEGRMIEVVEPTSPDTAMAEVKLERPESPEIRITDSPNLPLPPPPPTSTSNASSPSNPPTPASSSAYAKSPIGSPAAAAASAGSPQPSLPSPPLLFQPFLPNKNAAAAKSGALPFSIDNILKPSFGHRLQLLQTVAVAAAAAAHRQQQQELQQRQQGRHDLFQSDRLADHLASSQPQPPSPPPRTVPASNGGTGSLNNNRPVDLSRSSKPTAAAAAAPPSPEKKQPDSAGSSPLPLKKEDDGDCPPGMVRGPNGQLWPAWVFCTRYSDRPSSGELVSFTFKRGRPHCCRKFNVCQQLNPKQSLLFNLADHHFPKIFPRDCRLGCGGHYVVQWWWRERESCSRELPSRLNRLE